MTDRLRCGECGTVPVERSKFCGACGALFAGEPGERPATGQASGGGTARRGRWALLATAAAILAVLVAGAVLGSIDGVTGQVAVPTAPEPSASPPDRSRPPGPWAVPPIRGPVPEGWTLYEEPGLSLHLPEGWGVTTESLVPPYDILTVATFDLSPEALPEDPENCAPPFPNPALAAAGADDVLVTFSSPRYLTAERDEITPFGVVDLEEARLEEARQLHEESGGICGNDTLLYLPLAAAQEEWSYDVSLFVGTVAPRDVIDEALAVVNSFRAR